MIINSDMLPIWNTNSTDSLTTVVIRVVLTETDVEGTMDVEV